MALLSPKWLWRWVLIAAFAAILAANLPGHLSVDSVIALGEGRTGLRISWGPALYSRILGFFDAITPGGASYVVASLLVLLVAWAAMPLLRARTSWLAVALLVLCLATPQVFIYQAIVWKDVLFANLAIAAFVALGVAATHWQTPRTRWISVVIAWVALAVACLVRQNGAIAVLLAAPVVTWSARGDGWRRAAALGVATLAVPLILGAAINTVTPLTIPPGGKVFKNKGLRLVEHYDLVGAIAETPDRPLPYLLKDNPQYLAIIRREAPHVYSPIRSDAILGSSAYGHALWHFSDQAMADEWHSLIVHDPLGYARRRLQIFRWTFLTPDLSQCLAVHVGVEGPPALDQQLHLKEGQTPKDQGLLHYAQHWFKTPFYSHLFYAVIAGVIGIFLLVRRQASDIVMLGLMVAALAFAASFALISLACDYRYLYFTDLAAMTGALYVALDPRLKASSAARTAA